MSQCTNACTIWSLATEIADILYLCFWPVIPKWCKSISIILRCLCCCFFYLQQAQVEGKQTGKEKSMTNRREGTIWLELTEEARKATDEVQIDKRYLGKSTRTELGPAGESWEHCTEQLSTINKNIDRHWLQRKCHGQFLETTSETQTQGTSINREIMSKKLETETRREKAENGHKKEKAKAWWQENK